MNIQRGFGNVGTLISVMVGLMVLGGGVYYAMQQQASPQTTQESIKAEESKETDSDSGGAGAKSVLVRLDEHVSKDADSVYHTWGGEPYRLAGADAETFSAVSGEYYKDKNRVYFLNNGEGGGGIIPIEGIDPATFVPFSSYYVKDRKGVYFFRPKWLSKGEVVLMPFADAATFVVDKKYPSLAKDAKNVYWLSPEMSFTGDNPTAVGADSATFQPVLNGSYLFKDKNHVYSGISLANPASPMAIIPGANPAKFVSFGPKPDAPPLYTDSPYGTDGASVFYFDQQVTGADPTTFKLESLLDTYPSPDASDKNHLYLKGKIIN